jgi:hypothetical protein
LSNKDSEGGQTYISFFNNICKQLLKAGSNFVKSEAILAMQMLLVWVKNKGRGIPVFGPKTIINKSPGFPCSDFLVTLICS